MNTYEELAALTALEKAVKDRIKEVRSEANCDLMDAYDSMGVEKLALKIGGEKVGDFIVTFNKECFEITDRAAFEEFALDYGMAHIRHVIHPAMMSAAVNALEASLDKGDFEELMQTEVVISPDWDKAMTNTAGLVTYMDSGLPVPGVEFRPKTVKGTMVRECKPEQVFPLVSAMPGGFNGYLLGEGVA